jgi:TrmH family RNA methyltransferase
MLSRSQSSRIRGLHRRKGREEGGEFLIEGVRLVEDLLNSSIVPRLVIVSPSLEDTPRGRDLARRVRDQAMTVEVTETELAHLATTETTQGVLAVAAIPSRTLAEPLRTGSFVVVLDAVQDPGNFGTIVRSADAFGAAFVASLPGTVDPWNPKAVRSAAGSSLRVPIVATSLADLTAHLQVHDCVLFGADMSGISAEDVVRGGTVALALGNEGAGLSAAVRAACTELVSVPIRGSAESLNVGVAAGILMYLLSRKT